MSQGQLNRSKEPSRDTYHMNDSIIYPRLDGITIMKSSDSRRDNATGAEFSS